MSPIHLVQNGSRRTWQPWLLLCWLLIAASIGCGSGEHAVPVAAMRLPEGAQGPTVRLLGTLTLEEHDTSFVGRPVAFFIGPNGDVFISDAITPRVLRYNRRGELLRTYSRAGQGPGELQTPGHIGIVSDSLLLVLDSRPGKIEMFDLATAAHRGTVRLPASGRSFLVRGDTLFVMAAVTSRRTAMVRLLLRQPSEVSYLLPFPAEYAGNRLLTERYTTVAASLAGDTLLAMFGGNTTLLIGWTNGTMTDTVLVPAARRRGIPPDFSRRLTLARSQEEQIALSSVPRTVHRLTSGDIAVEHADLTLRSGALSGTGYISLVSGDLQRVCVDAPLELSPDGFARTAWRGDTLFVLEQIVGESTQATLLMRAFQVGADGCTWRTPGGD